MTKARQEGIQQPIARPNGLENVLGAVRSYLSERFPLVSLGGTVLSAYVCSYLLYGQAIGDQVFRWETVVGGVTVVLLALFRRIVDDVEDLHEDIRTGRFSFTDGGTLRLRGLLLGGLAVVGFAGFLNATCSLGLLLASVGVAAWFSLAMVIKNKTWIARVRPAKYLVVESCPVAFLLYGYAVWTEAAKDTLPALAVVAIIGLFWTTFQFWNFTRKIGTAGWPPWDLSVRQTLPALIVFLALAGVFSVLIAHYADLSVGYLIYGVALSVVFAIVILRWWPRLQHSKSAEVDAVWAGLPFAVGVEVGALIAVLAASF